jgi:hypothetical protein
MQSAELEAATSVNVGFSATAAGTQVGSIRVRRDPDLLRSFLTGTGLTI